MGRTALLGSIGQNNTEIKDETIGIEINPKHSQILLVKDLVIIKTKRIIIEIAKENLKTMRNSIAAILFFTFLASCNSDTIVGDTRALSGTWNKDKVIEFEIPPLDSLKSHHVFLQVRNSNDYKFNNLFLIVTLDFPHGKTITDTLEYRMARADGTWLGSGIGSIKENKFWYKENVTFKEEGTYKLTIAQAVRNNGDVNGVTNLAGITDVGYSIEVANE